MNTQDTRTTKELLDVQTDLLFATFFLDANEYAINIKAVREALDISEQEIIRVPNSPDYVEGITNIRGNVIPVLNLKKRFELGNTTYGPESRLVIAKCQGRFCGILFDSISEVIRVRKDLVEDIGIRFSKENSAVDGIIKFEKDKRIIQIIAPDLLVAAAEEVFCASDTDLDDKTEKSGQQCSDKERLQCMVFSLNGQELAVDVRNVREILENRQVQVKNVINLEAYIRKLILVRGEVLPIIDLKAYLTGEGGMDVPEARIIILMCSGSTFGILVDSIEKVISVDESDIVKMSTLVGNKNQNAFLGVVEYGKGRQAIILEIERLFENSITKRLDSVAALHRDEEMMKRTGSAEQSSSDGTDVYITFRVDEVLAINILCVQEIIDYTKEIIPVLGSREIFEGILNLRGRIIPIINFRRFYSLEEYKDISTAKILIFNEDSKLIGIIVDELVEIVKSSEANAISGHHFMNKNLEQRFKFKVKSLLELKSRKEEKNTVMVFDSRAFVHEIASWTGTEIAGGDSDNKADYEGMMTQASVEMAVSVDTAGTDRIADTENEGEVGREKEAPSSPAAYEGSPHGHNFVRDIFHIGKRN